MERAQLNRKFANILPPQAYVALRGLGFLTPSAPGSRGTSTTLPFFFEATQDYTPGGAGLIGQSNNVIENPGPPPSMDFSPGGASFPTNFAYALYRVDDVAPAPLSLQVSTAMTASDDVGVCVYNWAYGALGRWEPAFYGPPDEFGTMEVQLDGPAGAQWLSSGGDLAFVVFCLTPATVSVTGFTLSNVSANDPPLAMMQATPGSGPAPLTVVLDAGESYDGDGAIVQYRFDPLGDGNFVDNGSDATFDYTYTDAGAYYPVLEVTDNGGLTDTWETSVLASGSYDEQENNDDAASANDFPALPFTGFTGNIGPEGGNDGDSSDYFAFSYDQIGDEVKFIVDYNMDQGAVVNLYLTDAEGSPIKSIEGDLPPLSISHRFEGWEKNPITLHVYSVGGQSDYIISGEAVTYEETENNDTVAAADRLDDLTDLQEMADYDGSIGTGDGYPGYDGDDIDWFEFGAQQNAHLSLTIQYDATTAPEFGVSLFDSDPDELTSAVGGGGILQLEYDFTPDDTPSFRLRVTPGDGGYTDYQMDGTLTITNPGLDEQENNDDPDQANQLPDVPFDEPFEGNIGLGGNYDGDTYDYFTFNAGAGDKFQFVVTPSNPDADLDAYLSDSNGRTIGGTTEDPDTGVITVDVLIRTNDQAPFYLQLSEISFQHSTDYTIEGQLATFSESENNDTNLQANSFPSEFFQFFSGSQGSGGSGYDGDELDIFSFSADEGDTPGFVIFYDEATGDIYGHIKDSEGDILGDWEENSDNTILILTDEPIDADDVAPYFLEVTSDDDFYTDYWVSTGMF